MDPIRHHHSGDRTQPPREADRGPENDPIQEAAIRSKRERESAQTGVPDTVDPKKRRVEKKKREGQGPELEDKIKALQTIVLSRDFDQNFRRQADAELLILKEESPFGILPDEVVLHILSFIPDAFPNLEKVDKKLSALVKDPYVVDLYFERCFEEIRTKFVENGLQEARLDAHIEHVARGFNADSKAALLQGLINYQKERFPPPPFSCDIDPVTIEGFIQRELIIKKYNANMFAQRYAGEVLPFPGDIENIEQLNANYEWLLVNKDALFFSAESVSISDSPISELPAELISSLRSAREIDLSKNLISYVPSNCFQGLDHLQTLRLEHNKISILSDPSFSGLSDLKTLDLSGNNIRSLDENILSELVQLRTLFLNENQIKDLPEGLFAGLAEVSFISLAQNRIEALPEGVFAGLERLEQLVLFHNQIKDLPKGVFASLESLQELNLAHNRIEALPEDMLAGLERLRDLNLSENQIKDLPKGVFAGLESLQELHLALNRIEALPEGVFAGLGELETLQLNENQIKDLPEGVFAGLEGLHELHLGQNRIEDLPESVFAGLGELETLQLNENQIKDLPEGVFAGLEGLHELHLGQNRIEDLPESVFAGLEGLQELHLGQNRIKDLPEGVFAGLEELDKLNLSSNQIKDVTKLRLKLTNIKTLMLNHNDITGRGLDSLPQNTCSLSLSGCTALEDSSLAFLSMYPLTFLNVSACPKITSLGLFFLPQDLEWLCLDRCDQIDDTAIMSLLYLEKLERISVLGCKNVTAAGVENFKTRHSRGKSIAFLTDPA